MINEQRGRRSEWREEKWDQHILRSKYNLEERTTNSGKRSNNEPYAGSSEHRLKSREYEFKEELSERPAAYYAANSEKRETRTK